MLHNHLNRLLRRPDRLVDESEWYPRDRSVARWYCWLMLAGYVILAAMLISTAFPVGIRITELAIHELGKARSAIKISDAAVFLILNFWEPVLAAYLAIRAYRRRRAKATQETAVPVAVK